ncbi:hypothetical protein VP01_1431g1 [Puccinia sorghi]|uniref:Uncharacterized protein n=1 Tax=Puccinia sorghi TaxID=27349 RepID=A0A0L6VKX2_9BASI|nr:hypothetical protein VP01_1431g1 [Puccinia sorghi]
MMGSQKSCPRWALVPEEDFLGSTQLILQRAQSFPLELLDLQLIIKRWNPFVNSQGVIDLLYHLALYRILHRHSPILHTREHILHRRNQVHQHSLILHHIPNFRHNLHHTVHHRLHSLHHTVLHRLHSLHHSHHNLHRFFYPDSAMKKRNWFTYGKDCRNYQHDRCMGDNEGDLLVVGCLVRVTTPQRITSRSEVMPASPNLTETGLELVHQGAMTGCNHLSSYRWSNHHSSSKKNSAEARHSCFREPQHLYDSHLPSGLNWQSEALNSTDSNECPYDFNNNSEDTHPTTAKRVIRPNRPDRVNEGRLQTVCLLMTLFLSSDQHSNFHCENSRDKQEGNLNDAKDDDFLSHCQATYEQLLNPTGLQLQHGHPMAALDCQKWLKIAVCSHKLTPHYATPANVETVSLLIDQTPKAAWPSLPSKMIGSRLNHVLAGSLHHHSLYLKCGSIYCPIGQGFKEKKKKIFTSPWKIGHSDLIRDFRPTLYLFVQHCMDHFCPKLFQEKKNFGQQVFMPFHWVEPIPLIHCHQSLIANHNQTNSQARLYRLRRSTKHHAKSVGKYMKVAIKITPTKGPSPGKIWTECMPGDMKLLNLISSVAACHLLYSADFATYHLTFIPLKFVMVEETQACCFIQLSPENSSHFSVSFFWPGSDHWKVFHCQSFFHVFYFFFYFNVFSLDCFLSAFFWPCKALPGAVHSSQLISFYYINYSYYYCLNYKTGINCTRQCSNHVEYPDIVIESAQKMGKTIYCSQICCCGPHFSATKPLDSTCPNHHIRFKKAIYHRLRRNNHHLQTQDTNPNCWITINHCLASRLGPRPSQNDFILSHHETKRNYPSQNFPRLMEMMIPSPLFYYIQTDSELVRRLEIIPQSGHPWQFPEGVTGSQHFPIARQILRFDFIPDHIMLGLTEVLVDPHELMY